MGLVTKFKNFTASSLPASDDAVTGGISQKEIYQCRENFGVNFGGCFVREQWLFPSLFPQGTSTELEATKASVRQNRDEARKKLENHWKNYVNDNDWKWLKDQGVTGVRVPLGYWNIDNGNFTKKTKFAEFKDIYRSSWDIFKQKFVEPAAKHGISILVDIHALPGGANGEAHSGEVNGGDAGFWKSGDFRKLMVSALQFVAKDLRKYENICGIQIVNESVFENDPAKQKLYYSEALKAIRDVDKTVPVIISDGWWPSQWADWVKDSEGDYNSSGIVVDHHVYRCFDSDDKKKNAETIIKDLNGDMLTNIGNKGYCDFMVGEFSGVLDGETWVKSGLKADDWNNPKRKESVVKFLREQEKLFHQRATAGNYFWTYKFESGNGGEWDFRQQYGNAFKFPKVSVPSDDAFRNCLDRDFNGHVEYWKKQNPKEKFEHQRYKDAYKQAWNDATKFAKARSFIGRRYAVKCARRKQYIKAKGKSSFQWEWDQGYDKGLQEFYNNM